MYKSYGMLAVDRGLRLIVNHDFIAYYKWLIEKYNYNTEKLQFPMHGSHITLINPKIHKGFSYAPAIPYVGRNIAFTYNPFDIYESKVNFWLPVKCELGEELKRKCGIIESKNYLGNHLTICNRKFN